MLTPQQVLRITIEIIFVLLGGLVVWLGFSEHILFDRRKPGWLLLSAALSVWGVRVLYKPGQWSSPTEQWTRGSSLNLLDVEMLAISLVPFSFVGELLAFAGELLMLRVLIGVVLILRPR